MKHVDRIESSRSPEILSFLPLTSSSKQDRSNDLGAHCHAVEPIEHVTPKKRPLPRQRASSARTKPAHHDASKSSLIRSPLYAGLSPRPKESGISAAGQDLPSIDFGMHTARAASGSPEPRDQHQQQFVDMTVLESQDHQEDSLQFIEPPVVDLDRGKDRSFASHFDRVPSQSSITLVGEAELPRGSLETQDDEDEPLYQAGLPSNHATSKRARESAIGK